MIKMNAIKQIQRSYSIVNNNEILPCSKYFCICIEYLNFASKKDIRLYKQCYIGRNNLADGNMQLGKPINKMDIVHKPYIQTISYLNK